MTYRLVSDDNVCSVRYTESVAAARGFDDIIIASPHSGDPAVAQFLSSTDSITGSLSGVCMGS